MTPFHFRIVSPRPFVYFSCGRVDDPSGWVADQWRLHQPGTDFACGWLSVAAREAVRFHEAESLVACRGRGCVPVFLLGRPGVACPWGDPPGLIARLRMLGMPAEGTT